MANERNRTKVMINDQEYTVVGNKSSAHVELVAQTVNEQLTELKQLSNNKLSVEEQAILMAINAVSDQIETHKKMIEMEEKLNKLTDKKKK